MNLLVTPERLPGQPTLLDELGDPGCRDVLLRSRLRAVVRTTPRYDMSVLGW